MRHSASKVTVSPKLSGRVERRTEVDQEQHDPSTRPWWRRGQATRLREAIERGAASLPRPPHPVTRVQTLDEILSGASQASTHAAARAADEAASATAEAAAEAAKEVARTIEEHTGDVDRFGRPGRAFNRSHPFYVGFVGAFGVLIAYGLVQLLGQLSQVITLLVVSLFLALGLEPVVEGLEKRRVPRPAAIGVVFLGVIAVVAAFIAAVIPIIVTQSADLAGQVPQYLEDVQRSRWFIDLDARFDIVSRLTTEVEERIANEETVAALFGGVFGAGAKVLSGLFSTFTVLVLTLYFLASLRPIKESAYRLVPSSRRQRVTLIGDEISRRIGGFVIGQISVATINAVASYVMMLIVGIPYPLVLAVTVGIFGLVPLVGATVGAVLVVVVALFTSVTDAAIVAVYFVAYQQFENYVIAPRIMQRTVSVPGALVIVAALAGGSLLGALGALIAIPIAAGVLLVVQEVVMPRQQRA